MRRDYVQWHSPRLGRTMELLWYGHWGRPVVLFPTSAGRFWENEDFELVGSLGDKIDRGELQVVCVDTVNGESWYNRDAHPYYRIRRHEQYDAYLRQEFLPYVANRAARGDIILYGASFGAYHAANLAMRYPDVISRVILFSGVYDTHSFLDGYWDDGCYFHCPTAAIPNMDREHASRLASVEWVIATGEHDHLAGRNRWFSEMLWGKGIPNHFELWPGQFGHDWPWWREHLKRFVP